MPVTIDGPSSNALFVVALLIVVGALYAAVDFALAFASAGNRLLLIEVPPRYQVAYARIMNSGSAVRARYTAGRILAVGAAATLAALYALASGAGMLASVLAGLGVAWVYGLVAQFVVSLVRPRAEQAVLPLVYWFRPFEMLVAPIAQPLVWVNSMAQRFVPTKRTIDDVEVDAAVERIIEQGEERGSIPADYAEMLRSVLEFKNTVAREVMIPRTEIVAINITTPLPEVLKIVNDSVHSRYPVYRDRLDQIEGLLYAKDLFRAVSGRDIASVDLERVIRKPVMFVPESQKIGLILKDMRARRVHLAVVVDEFGGTSGIVTLEDIIEEIVGEIRDEHDVEERGVRQLGPGHYLVDGRMSVHDLKEQVGLRLPNDRNGYDSLGGMVVDLAGRVPEAGESVEANGVRYCVREADARRVTLVEIIQPQASQPPRVDAAAATS